MKDFKLLTKLVCSLSLNEAKGASLLPDPSLGAGFGKPEMAPIVNIILRREDALQYFAVNIDTKTLNWSRTSWVWGIGNSCPWTGSMWVCECPFQHLLAVGGSVTQEKIFG